MFEFLFCPQHGLFRVENIAWGAAYAGNFLMWLKFWISYIVRSIREWF